MPGLIFISGAQGRATESLQVRALLAAHMTEAVSIRPEPLPAAPLDALFAAAHRATRGWLKWLFIGLGWLLIAGGLVLALLPGHLGVPLLAVGVIVVLRNSYRARRQFIHLQRRHPRFV